MYKIKWIEILLDDVYSDNKRSQEIHNAEEYVEAKGIIKHNMWFKYLQQVIFTNYILFILLYIAYLLY